MSAEALFWIAQGIGALAAVLGVIAFQMSRHTLLLVLLGLSALTWAVHFLLLAAPAAAAINTVTAARNFCGIRFSGPWVGGGFASFYVIAAAASFTSPWDLLPLAAVLSGTASVFLLQGMKARSGFLAGSVLWIVYNLRVGSLAGVIIMAADAASNIRFILRWR